MAQNEEKSPEPRFVDNLDKNDAIDVPPLANSSLQTPTTGDVSGNNETSSEGVFIDGGNSHNGEKMAQEVEFPPNIINTSSKPSPRQRNLMDFSGNEERFERGYDSDGEIGPFNETEEVEGDQFFDEIDECIPENHHYAMNQCMMCPKIFDNDRILPIEPDPTLRVDLEEPYDLDLENKKVHIPIDEAVLVKFKMKELKHELELRGQPTQGAKGVLRRRLQRALGRENSWWHFPKKE